VAAASFVALHAGPLRAEDDNAGTWVADIRYRAARIDTDGYSVPANAHTVRVLLGYLWASAPHWRLYAEGTGVFGLFGDDYNNGANGKTGLPSESDPPSSEITGLWLEYRDASAQARLGRQYVNLDNQRFFTSGQWRQNPQSFDAFAATWQPLDGTSFRYFHLDNVQRTVGHDYPDPEQREWDLDAHLLHLDQRLPLGALAYGYLVENFTQAKYSWRTEGLRWAGAEEFFASRLAWTLEGAQQHDWRNNPSSYTADYHLLELSYGVSMAGLRLGDEVLGGNGHVAFSSPYGSNHAFNGWASEFKNIPPNGLDDRYAGGFGKLIEPLGWNVTWHNFFAERGSQRYGSEIDGGLTYAFRRNWSAEIDYADYHGNGFAVSERKLWLVLEYRRGPGAEPP